MAVGTAAQQQSVGHTMHPTEEKIDLVVTKIANQLSVVMHEQFVNIIRAEVNTFVTLCEQSLYCGGGANVYYRPSPARNCWNSFLNSAVIH